MDCFRANDTWLEYLTAVTARRHHAEVRVATGIVALLPPATDSRIRR
jgi:hypothetical protein